MVISLPVARVPGLEVGARSKSDGEFCGGFQANGREHSEKGCSDCVGEIHFVTCGCRSRGWCNCAPPKERERDREFSDLDFWQDESSCFKQKQEELAAKKAREAARKQSMWLNEKTAKEASRVETALAFMKTQITTKTSPKAQHYDVISISLKQYH